VVGIGAQWLLTGDLWQLLIGGVLAVVVYGVIVLPMRHEAFSVLRRATG
jgi:hypothetical protein